MSIFDPKTFESMTFQESNSTESTPCPVGEWPFTITKRAVTPWQSKQDSSKAGLKLTLSLETEDAAVTGVTGRPKNVLQYEIMLDLTPEGGLDFGKGMNVNLGRARAACGLNNPGAPFSFDMFLGHTVKAAVRHESYQERLLAKVSGIATL